MPTWRPPSTRCDLNRAASEVLVRHGIRGATDVTGFGLLGHGLEMARASGARLVFEAVALPALAGALEVARAGVETGGAGHNRRFTAPSLVVTAGVAPELVALAHDPQTSGGLLAAIPATDAAAVVPCARDGRRPGLAGRRRGGGHARGRAPVADARSRAGAMPDPGFPQLPSNVPSIHSGSSSSIERISR